MPTVDIKKEIEAHRQKSAEFKAHYDALKIAPRLTKKQIIKLINDQGGMFCNIISKEHYLIYKDYLKYNKDNIIDIDYNKCLADLTLDKFTYADNTIYYAKFKIRAKIQIKYY